MRARLFGVGLYDMTSGALVPVSVTSFTAEQIFERKDLQAALRDNIAALGDDLLVVSEEFGGFAGASRRIDLLCIDRAARLVVIELKRTEDGGHLELQALRYAAMVSAMTFDELVDIYDAHLARQGGGSSEHDARSMLSDWLDDAGGEDTVLSREVRIVLAASGFDREITTTVLWLNDVFGMDIRCVRLTPYKYGSNVLLDVQAVIPLPEAEELTVKLRSAKQRPGLRRNRAVTTRSTKSSRRAGRLVPCRSDERRTPSFSRYTPPALQALNLERGCTLVISYRCPACLRATSLLPNSLLNIRTRRDRSVAGSWTARSTTTTRLGCSATSGAASLSRSSTAC